MTTRLQLWGTAALLLVCLLLLGNAIWLSPETPFLSGGPGGQWIGHPLAVDTNAILIDREQPPVFTFVGRFELPPETAEGGPVVLEGRALRDAALTLNDAAVVVEPLGRTWRQGFRADISGQLRAGTNELRVAVWNPKGPALLQLVVRGEDTLGAKTRGEDTLLQSDTHWRVIPPAPPGRSAPAVAAVLADDTRPSPESFGVPGPGQALPGRALALVLLFAASAALYLVAQGKASAEWNARLPRVTLALVTLYWLAVFAFKLSRMPVMVGFDIPSHLMYLDILLEEHRLPMADEGWSTYHPPFYHLLTGLAVALTGVARESTAGSIVYRLVGFSAGLANVWLCHLAALRIFVGDPRKVALATAFAGLLPMNLYVSAYVSNEALQSACVSLALLLACRAILDGRYPATRLAQIALALGLAILTKVTSILTVPVVAFFVAAGRWLGGEEPTERQQGYAGREEQRALWRGVGVGAALLGGVALVAGWFYLRAWIHHGSPIVINVELPGRVGWWSQPGFHTWSYYTGFGDVLQRPFFAGFHSFWDGVYSTFWGDGLLAGMIRAETRHPFWRYDYMSLGYWLALPATLLLGAGLVRLAREALTDGDTRRRIALSMLLTTLYVLAFALLLVTFRAPFYSQAKAFYILSAVVPLSLVAGAGLSLVPDALAGDRHRILRALYYGWLGTTAGCLALSYLG
ncbi:MAG: glycosyltransferase family 39 protein [Deltaproteobacteria bacterium]|nr:glycosyltransferase family 39 protein [Deltaproteobacteria bacterium]MBW2419519.1 glycosyltransferase family 39 protein [Deltaproteobacteria bacterium]